MQTKSVTSFPLVLFGKQYYKELWEAMQDMAKRGTIAEEDLDFVLFTDSVQEAMEHISKYIVTNYKILPRKRLWWLLEKK